MKIYLARHGQDEDNAQGILNGHRDTALTPKGLEQAKELADKIAQEHLQFDHIFSSPLQRALNTAQIIAHTTHGAPPVVLLELIERNFGVMTGLPLSRIPELCAPNIIQTETITYFLSPEGAETFPDLLVRSDVLLHKLQSQVQGSVLLVTHGDVGKMIYAAYYHLPWKDVLTQFHFGNSELLLLSEESSAKEAHVFKVVQYNS